MGLIGYTDSQYYTDIANMIRQKTGSTSTFRPDQMAAAIQTVGGATDSLYVIPTGSTQVFSAPSLGLAGYDNVTVAGISLTPMVVTPSAEIVATYSYDGWAVADDSVTLPTYTTSATVAIASVALTSKVTLDVDNYNYYVVERCITLPSYSDDTKAKGRVDYDVSSICYEIVNIPANIHKTTTGDVYQSRNITVYATGALYRLIYWTSATAFAIYNSSYGIYQSGAAPTLSSATASGPTLTLKSPVLYMRGSTTYFTSAQWAKLVDIRRQWKIEVYRVQKNLFNVEGWINKQNMMHVLNDCANNSFNLT